MPTAARVLTEAERYVLRQIYALENRTVALLFEQYADAYRRMVDALNRVWQNYGTGDTWSARDAAFRRRTEALLAQLRAEMDELALISGDFALDAAEDGYRAGAVGRAYVLDQIGADTRLPLLPVEAIRAQLLAPYEGSTFVDRFQDNRNEFVTRIRRALVQSQIEGEGIFKAQQRIADALGIKLSDIKSPGSKAHRANFYRTQNIARTEILRASNLGTLAIYRENADVLKGWEWQATLDDRTCPICAPLDGKQFLLDSNRAPPPAHPQCRCTATPVLIDQELERRIVGPRETFMEWAQRRGITRNVYGQAFDFKGQDAPRLKLEVVA